MAGLKADMPDFVDSGGPRTIGADMVMNQVIPLVLGTAAAGLAVLLGLGVLNSARPVLRNVPLVGSLLRSGGDGDDRPAAWRGL